MSTPGVEYQLEIYGPDERGVLLWHRQPPTYPTASAAAMAAVAVGLPLDTASDGDTNDGAETWRIVPVRAAAELVYTDSRNTYEQACKADVIWCDGERVVRREDPHDARAVPAALAHTAVMVEPGRVLDVRG